MHVRRLGRLLSRSVACLALVLAGALQATAASADTQPLDPSIPVTVSADPLPTVQINGVVWSQAVVGNTVYAAGSFTTARPAGAAPGTQTTTRHNLLAYDITTGKLITSFAPDLNGQALVVKASPDMTRIYVGGTFTEANGLSRSRVVAYSTSTGEVITTFAPSAGATVRSITATNATVYLGGDFTTVSGLARPYVAAIDAVTGKPTTYNPKPNAPVTAMTLAAGDQKLVLGGRFTKVGASAAYGMAALHRATGALWPWGVGSTIRDAGVNSSITSLTSDGTSVYGTGYVFGAGGNFEGTFRADSATGEIVWMEDCHGDSYSAFATPTVVYVPSHSHYCGNIGGFPEGVPRVNYRATAFTNKATGTITKNAVGNYANFAGKPSPSLLTWYPTLWPGTYTDQGQAAWSVAGNANYVVYGGEFPTVNTTPQQGLVRFAVPSLAPNLLRPDPDAGLTPTATSTLPGQATISWKTTNDRDNQTLTYKVYRNYTVVTAAPVCTVTDSSLFWEQKALSCVDANAPPGATVTYRVIAFDPYQNRNTGNLATVTINSGQTTAPTGFTGTTPTRVLDTRTGIGAPAAKLGAGATLTLTVPGLPAGVTAVAVNVTATAPTATSFLTAYPGGTTRPTASNLNFAAGQTIPNLVLVPLGADGTVTFYNKAGTVDVIADLVGYYS